MGIERYTDGYTTYDWKPELFWKMKLEVNISPMSKKFNFAGPKSTMYYF